MQTEGKSPIRKCNECGRDLPLTDEFFYRRSDNRELFHWRCKDCYRRYMREHYTATHAKEREARQDYLVTKRNPATGTVLCTRCQRLLPVAEFYTDSRCSGGLSPWCKRCISEYGVTWRTANKDAVAARGKDRRFGYRLSALVYYGGDPPSCACCNESRLEFLALDHIGGGGRQERLRVGSGERFFRYLQKTNYPPGYRVLCHNCNQAMGIYGYCPHQIENKEGK